MVLKHAVDPLMEATGKLYGGRVPHLCSGMQEYFRDVYDHLHRIHGTIEGIREMLTTAIQVNLGMISLSENEVTKKLAAWAAIIAVPTMVAGIYGMNFEHMPELKWEYGYFVSIAMMALADLYLYYRFKKSPLAVANPGHLSATGGPGSVTVALTSVVTGATGITLPDGGGTGHAGCNVTWSIAKSRASIRCAAASARGHAAPSVSITCADSATRSALICQTWRSWMPVTPGSFASARPTAS